MPKQIHAAWTCNGIDYGARGADKRRRKHNKAIRGAVYTRTDADAFDGSNPPTCPKCGLKMSHEDRTLLSNIFSV